MKVAPNDSPTQVSYPHCIHCFALAALETKLLTKNDICDNYDVIIASLCAKLFSLVYWAYYFQICRRKNVYPRVIKQGLTKL